MEAIKAQMKIIRDHEAFVWEISVFVLSLSDESKMMLSILSATLESGQ